ncbi:MAG: DUF4129 domain-containing protein [Saprospiraceae bacterium]
MQRLYEKGMIHWRKEHTNRVYLRQMGDSPNFADFRQLTYTYEWVWYGGNPPDAAGYASIKERFAHFFTQLNSPQPK